MDAVVAKKFARRYLILFLISFILLVFVGCQNNHKHRPYGWFRLGKVVDFLGPETNLADAKLIVRRDSRGLYVMSTICTYDLTYLTKKKVGDREIYVSDYSSSTYDLDGNVLTGPTIARLPHYELKIDFGVDGKARDSLYAIVGEEVSPEWRLELPAK